MPLRALASATLLVLAAAGPIAAADGGSWDYWARVQAGAGLQGLAGDAAYTDQGLTGTTFSVGDVGLDDAEVAPFVELGVGTPIFDIHGYLGYSSFSTEGSRSLGRTINFGGRTFNAGATVQSESSISDLYAEVNWSPIALNVAGFSLGLAVHQLEVAASLDSSGLKTEAEESATIPALAVRAYVAPLDMLEAEVAVHGLAVPLGDASGTYLWAQAQVSYYPVSLVGVIAGWRHTAVDVDIESGARTIAAKVALSGPFLGLAAQF